MLAAWRCALLTVVILAAWPASAAGAWAAGPWVHTPAGPTLAWRDLRGQSLVLVFHGSGPECVRDAQLHDLAFQYADRQVHLVEVFTRAPSRHGACPTTVRGAQAVDRAGVLARRYQVRRTPVALFLDRRGRVVARLAFPQATATWLKAVRRTLP